MSASRLIPFGMDWRRSALIVLAAAVLVGAAFLVLIQVSPWYVGLGDDSGLFAYGGRRILQGDLLYRDVWDTKPPGVFYVNALALALGGETPWAIWWFQLAWIGLTTVALLVLLARLAGLAAGLLSTGLFLFTALYPDYFQGGNLTEIYALLPQVLVLVAAARYFRRGRSGWLMGVGLATGFAFVLKPTYVALGAAALWIAAMQALNRRGPRGALRPLAAAAGGFLVPVLAIVLSWGAHGALGDLWAAVFEHNVGYVQQGLSLRSLYGTARSFLVNPPLVFLTVLAVGGATKYAFEYLPASRRTASQMLPGFDSDSAGQTSRDWRRLVFEVALVALPIEAALVALSGRNFGHYFLTPLPAMAVAIAYLLQDLLPPPARLRNFSVWRGVSLALAMMLLVAWGLQIGPQELPRRAHLVDLTERPLSGEYWTDDLEGYVAAHTAPSEPVLVWGYNPGLHFLTGRRAPSRYLFHAQLFTPTPEARQRFDRFIRDLETNLPALIVAQPESPHAIPFFGAGGEDFCPGCTLAARDQLAAFREFVETRYDLVERIDGWVIYELAGEGS